MAGADNNVDPSAGVGVCTVALLRPKAARIRRMRCHVVITLIPRTANEPPTHANAIAVCRAQRLYEMKCGFFLFCVSFSFYLFLGMSAFSDVTVVIVVVVVVVVR